MNSILSQTQNSLRPLNKSKKNKRTIPININSNPYPCKFMFKNEKSHIANSYMNIGNEIHKKQKKIENDFKFSDIYNTNQNITNNNLSNQLSKCSYNTINNQSHLDKKKLKISTNILLNDYKNKNSVNSSFLFKSGFSNIIKDKKKNSRIIKNKQNLKENSKEKNHFSKSKIQYSQRNKSSNRKERKEYKNKNINNLSKEKNKKVESAIVTTINSINNKKQEKSKESHKLFINNIQKKLFGLKQNDNYKLQKFNKNINKDKPKKKTISKDKNNIFQSLKNNPNLINFSKLNNNLKREKKISKLLKYENNNIQSFINVGKIEEESKLNKENSKDSSQLIKKSPPLLIIDKKEEDYINKKPNLKEEDNINKKPTLKEEDYIYKKPTLKEEDYINKKSTLKDPNEIKGVEHDMPLALDTIMFSFSPIKNVEKKKIINDLFNEDNLEDFSIEKDDNFNNLHSIVKKINFNKIIVNCGNLFSQNNQKYINYFYLFNKHFIEENNIKKKNLINNNNDKNLSFSTQQGSNKKDCMNNE